MYRRIFNQPLVALSEADLQSLVEREVSEGLYLDYKLELPRKKGERKEVAEDAAAFANAYGGYLIYGVREEEGVAREIVGLKDLDPDKAVSALENAIRDLTEPTVEVHTVPIKLASGRFALVVEVPRSLNAPHIADGRFYRRAGRSSAPMGYMDIRRAFAERGDVIRKLRERFQQWVTDLELGHGPVEWGPQPSMFLYVASIPAFDAGLARVFGPEDQARVHQLSVTSGDAADTWFAADGLVAERQDGDCPRFALLTPEGELLHGQGQACIEKAANPPYVLVDSVKSDVLTLLGKNLPRLAALGFDPPYYVALALARMKGRRLRCKEPPHPEDPYIKMAPVERVALRPFILYDQVLLEEDARTVSQAIGSHQSSEANDRVWRERAARLKPILDRLYQAAGASYSPIAHALDGSQ